MDINTSAYKMVNRFSWFAKRFEEIKEIYRTRRYSLFSQEQQEILEKTFAVIESKKEHAEKMISFMRSNDVDAIELETENKCWGDTSYEEVYYEIREYFLSRFPRKYNFIELSDIYDNNEYEKCHVMIDPESILKCLRLGIPYQLADMSDGQYTFSSRLYNEDGIVYFEAIMNNEYWYKHVPLNNSRGELLSRGFLDTCLQVGDWFDEMLMEYSHLDIV